jgi:hypothetical protein
LPALTTTAVTWRSLPPPAARRSGPLTGSAGIAPIVDASEFRIRRHRSTCSTAAHGPDSRSLAAVRPFRSINRRADHAHRWSGVAGTGYGCGRVRGAGRRGREGWRRRQNHWFWASPSALPSARHRQDLAIVASGPDAETWGHRSDIPRPRRHGSCGGCRRERGTGGHPVPRRYS